MFVRFACFPHFRKAQGVAVVCSGLDAEFAANQPFKSSQS